VRFILPSTAIDGDVATTSHVDGLLRRVVDEVHILILPDGSDLEKTAFFRECRPHIKELLRRAVQATAFQPAPASGPHSRSFVIGEDVTVSQAERLAYTPLIVLVENRETDGILVEAAIELLATREVVSLWSTNFSTGKAAKPDSGGGTGELQKAIDTICGEAKSFGVPPRLVVMTDSDARWPGSVSAKAVSIEDACQARDVAAVVLSCKAIENYIPDIVLRHWASHPGRVRARPAVDALSRLSPEGRDHFPMKGRKGKNSPTPNRGFAAIDHPSAPPEQISLYAAVVPEDRTALLDGFPDDIIWALKTHIGELSAAHLESRDSRGDLRRLVELISNAL